MSQEHFIRYWQSVRGPIGARIPHLRRLIQSCAITVPGDRYRPFYEGVAELWFDDVEDLLAARHSREWQAASEDEANFINPNKVAYLVTEEYVILDQGH